MRDLYHAFGLLAVDNALRQSVTAACGFLPRPDLKLSKEQSPFKFDFQWEVQPDPAQLDVLASMFASRGVFLCAYELAEINRLLAITTLCVALDTVGANLRTAMQLSYLCDRRILVAVGALMADGDFLTAFVVGTETLTTPEFGLTADVATGLFNLFSSSVMRSACNDVDGPGWPGTTCLVSVRPYPQMISFNA